MVITGTLTKDVNKEILKIYDPKSHFRINNLSFYDSFLYIWRGTHIVLCFDQLRHCMDRTNETYLKARLEMPSCGKK